MMFQNVVAENESLPLELFSKGISNWSLDTLNVTLPPDAFTLHSDELRAKSVIETEWDEETGEVYCERKKVKAQTVTGSSGTKYVVMKDRRTGGSSLRLELTSKSLHGKYLHGISTHTLSSLLREVLSDGVCEFASGIHSDRVAVTDFDFQRLFIWEQSPQMLCDYYTHLSTCYEPVSLKGRHFRKYTDIHKGNIGFELNERRHTKHIGSAHIKAYFKGGELLTKGEDMLQYLTVSEHYLSRLHRQELTVSGKAQAKALGLTGTSLTNVLQMPQDLISGALEKVMDSNFKARHMKPQTHTESLSTSEELTANFLTYLLPKVGYLEAMDIATKSYPYSTRDRKSKVKGQVRKIAQMLISQGVKPKPLSEHSPEPEEELESVDFLQRIFGR